MAMTVQSIFATIKSMCEHTGDRLIWTKADRTVQETFTDLLTSSGVKYKMIDNTSYCDYNETIVHYITVAWLERGELEMETLCVEEEVEGEA